MRFLRKYHVMHSPSNIAATIAKDPGRTTTRIPGVEGEPESPLGSSVVTMVFAGELFEAGVAVRGVEAEGKVSTEMTEKETMSELPELLKPKPSLRVCLYSRP